MRTAARPWRTACCILSTLLALSFCIPAQAAQKAVKKKKAAPAAEAQADQPKTPAEAPKWPVEYSETLPGAVLPQKRVLAFYGNFYSTRMGILGELPPDQMLARLRQEMERWQAADPSTPIQPALHYVAVTAQGAPGADKKYRLRMPFDQIDKVLDLAAKVDGIVFLDVQVGHSTLQEELPRLEKYLMMPNVHLGIDPEFSMTRGHKPGTVIGTFDAAHVNFAGEYLAGLVRQHNLPPKMLVVHRFTRNMLTNYKGIKLRPEVQFIMDMDGWGEPQKKITTYKLFIYPEPVQFTGFKLFYKNDTRTVKTMLTPQQVLALTPAPMYIQYQ